jgi:hypothetical protein
MADNLQTPQQQPSVANLVGGIISDAERLVRQELTLARREIQEELTKAKTAAVSLLAGVAVTALGGLLLAFMLAQGLYTLTGYADPSPGLPLWGCYGIVGGLLLAAGIAMLYAGKTKADEVNLVPKQTVETLQENVQWLQNQNQT